MILLVWCAWILRLVAVDTYWSPRNQELSRLRYFSGIPLHSFTQGDLAGTSFNSHSAFVSHILPPAKLREGNVFTGAFHSVCGRGPRVTITHDVLGPTSPTPHRGPLLLTSVPYLLCTHPVNAQ